MNRLSAAFQNGIKYANNQECEYHIANEQELVAFNAGIFRANTLGANAAPIIMLEPNSNQSKEYLN